MPHPFDVIGSCIAESLVGTDWHDAWLKVALVDDGVMDSTQRFRTSPSGPEVDFVLSGPFRVMDAAEAHLRERMSSGFPRWRALRFHLERSGEFDVEYLYDANAQANAGDRVH